jgi:hypothetical protein
MNRYALSPSARHVYDFMLLSLIRQTQMDTNSSTWPATTSFSKHMPPAHRATKWVFRFLNIWMFGHPWRWKQALQWNVASQRKTMTKFRAERQKCRRVTFQHHLYLAVSPTCWRSSSSPFYQTSFCYKPLHSTRGRSEICCFLRPWLILPSDTMILE